MITCWELRVAGTDISAIASYDFRLTRGRKTPDVQPQPATAAFNVTTPDDAAWARLGAEVVLTALIGPTRKRVLVATMIVSQATRVFRPSTGGYYVALNAVGTLGLLARDKVPVGAIMGTEGEVARVHRLISTYTGQALEWAKSSSNRLLSEALSDPLWTATGTAPVIHTRDLSGVITDRARTYYFQADVTIDGPGLIALWALGANRVMYDAPEPGTYRLEAFVTGQLVPPGDAPTMAVIVGPHAAGLKWDDVPPTVTWATYTPPAQKWSSGSTPPVVTASHVQVWDAVKALPDSVMINPHDGSEESDVLTLAQAVSKAARGVLWETASGALHYESSLHRLLPAAPELTIDACYLLGDTEHRSVIGDVINRVRVEYWLAGATSDQPRPHVTIEDAASQAHHGVLEVTLTGPLADIQGATAVADLLIKTRAEPKPRLRSATTVDISKLPDPLTEDLLEMSAGALVVITGAAPGWLEGAQYEAYYEGLEIQGSKNGTARLTLSLSPRSDSIALASARVALTAMDAAHAGPPGDAMTAAHPSPLKMPPVHYVTTGHIGAKGPKGDKGIAGPVGGLGPTGPTGPRGNDGPQGASVTGPAGHLGHVGPPGHKGDAGDRGAAGTAGPAGHIGADGPAGVAGPRGQGLRVEAAVATKADLPAAGGEPGAVHYVTADGSLYIWGETSTGGNDHTWHLIGHVEGPTGPAGSQGPRGLTGAPGHIGPDGPAGGAGADGHRGPPGDAGHVGAAGPKGDPGTVGHVGGTGPKGDDGDPGPTGKSGPTGHTGTRGPDGAKGDTGDTGPRGGAGATGHVGGAGPKGDDGAPGLGIQFLGSVATKAALPAHGAHIGDAHLVKADGLLYVYGADHAWHTVGHIVGPAGPPGASITGAAGPTGHVGDTGAKGDKGDPGVGVTGSAGPTGHIGPRGPKGTTGDTGAKGDPGATGHVGGAGPKGDPGVGTKGATGSAGPAGHVGPRGGAGPAGHIGADGPRGAAGAVGTGVRIKGTVATVTALHALTGALDGDVHYVKATGDLYVYHLSGKTWEDLGHVQGPQGVTGGPGPRGTAGAAGHVGAPGTAGHDGTPGTKGDAGAAGAAGATGAAARAVKVTVSATAPAGPVAGDFWVKP